MKMHWVADPETKTLFVVPDEAVAGVEPPLQALSENQARNAFYSGFNAPQSHNEQLRELLGMKNKTGVKQ